ncbi:MBL fold metallo-hydrolase [Pelomyxa schiedti]|nr:MBL fold metallo-hydrolase [Pelomyxa schiedti]
MARGLLFVCIFVACALAATTPFTIYFFDVGQGDTSLIVFPNGYSLLIDCMEASTSSNANAVKIASRIREITGGSYVNATLITHIHTDHIGYPLKGGVWSLIEQQGITFGKLVDRNCASWTDNNKDGTCTSSEFTYIYCGSVGTTCTNWVCWDRNPASTKIYPVREQATVCSKTQIDPKYTGASVTITSADGVGAYTSAGKPLNADRTGDSTPPSENDYSLGVLVQFGQFLYSTTGDISGEYSGSYNNVEQYVQGRIGPIDVMKVNHHGSSHSTNQEWVDTLQPTVSLISVGASNSYGHPTQQTLDRLQAAGSVVIATEKGNPTADWGDAISANGDIIITCPDDKCATYTVQAGTVSTRTYTTKGVTPPTCAI